MRGSIAMLVRKDAPGQPRILHAGLRCGGPAPKAQAAAAGALWAQAIPHFAPGSRSLGSALSVASVGRRVVDALIPPTEAPWGECFALDPFLRLLVDGLRVPGRQGRVMLCLGEEGTAGVLALDGPGLPARV